MSKEVIFSSKNPILTAQECSNFLMDIANKLQAGEVELKGSDNSFTVELPDSLELDLSVKKREKKGVVKHKLDIEISWKEGTTNSLNLN